MNTNWIKILFVFCIKFQSVSFAQSYCTLYPKECTFTLEFFKKHKEKFEGAAKITGLASSFIYAIVAPELSQFSYLSDKLESYSLKVMYVQGGAEYANFSIGYFQMKPSFVERLEEFVQADSLLRRKYGDCLFIKPQERAARVTRIDRLSTNEWQIKYLEIFCDVVQKRFKDIVFSNYEERLQFFAAAYNCGFYKSEQQIKKTEQLALFPHFSQKKFRYSYLSKLFYQQLTQK